jgi:membrane-bound lytic murein transglycosylase D
MSENSNSSNRLTDVSRYPGIRVTLEKGDSPQTEYEFRNSFQIGRDETCDIRITENGISRFHAEVFLKNGQWWIRDLGSTNGTYFGGKRIEEFPLEKYKKIELGLGAAILSFEPQEMAPHEVTRKEKIASVNDYVEHYFGASEDQNIGEHTRMIRDAFQIVQKKHTSKYILIISIIGVLLIIAGIYGFQKQRQVKRQQLLAEGIFYSMKTIELELADFRKNAEISSDAAALQEIQKYRTRQKEMSENYDQFLRELHVYDESKMDETDQLILRVARIFGECELAMPKDFVGEVKNYIKKWQTTDRLENAIARAQQNAYVDKIATIMLENDLPPQFFYLALQESDFRLQTIGPPTRYGIAKGIWQFIPRTALKYGLRTGPLVEIEKYDPRDDRFNFEKSTGAAARYIRDIYNTDAQASGLLVIASYNWGERKVASYIQKMPQNPRERNFWQLLKKYRQQFPLETYNYVFYIISAAVIGENPKLFGFDFENPLANVNDNIYKITH